MSMVRGFLLLALISGGSAVLAGCATDDNTPEVELLPGFDPGPVPENGQQFILPIVHDLEPGTSHEICSYTGIKLTEDLDVRRLESMQAKAGHHVALYGSKVNQPAGTSHECTDADMVNFRFVAAANANQFNEAPGDLVYRIPAGTYLAAQEHYINSSDTATDSQSAFNIINADPGTSYTPSTGLAFLNTVLDIKPGQQSLDVHCTMDHDVKAWFTMPHMHKFGTAFKATHTKADGTVETLSDEAQWDPDYEFNAPMQQFDPATPLLYQTGDSIDVHCAWDNTTSGDLKFGQEMCVFFSQTIDEQNLGNLACDNGEWTPF